MCVYDTEMLNINITKNTRHMSFQCMSFQCINNLIWRNLTKSTGWQPFDKVGRSVQLTHWSSFMKFHSQQNNSTHGPTARHPPSQPVPATYPWWLSESMNLGCFHLFAILGFGRLLLREPPVSTGPRNNASGTWILTGLKKPAGVDLDVNWTL